MPVQGDGGGYSTPPCPVPVIGSPLNDVTVTCYQDNAVSLVVQLMPGFEQTSPFYAWYDGDDNPIATAPNTGNYMFIVSGADDGKIFYCKVTNDCGKTVNSKKFTLNVQPNPSVLPPGIGGNMTGASFTGRTCFDINRSNFDGVCGAQSTRTSNEANFKALGGIDYIFTAPSSGTVSNLRFIVIDSEGCVSSYHAGNISGTMANSSTATLTVYYKPNLNEPTSVPLIIGRTSDTAAKVTLYAIYGYNGSDVSIPLTVSIQDCTCCMGALALGSEYKQLQTYVPNSDLSPAGGNFIATGRNLCIAKTDAMTFATWDAALNGCITGLLNNGTEGWRLPNLAELGAMYGVRNNLETAPNSAPGTTNMAADYWSSSKSGSSSAWHWNFSYIGIIVVAPTNENRFFRCVRSF